MNISTNDKNCYIKYICGIPVIVNGNCSKSCSKKEDELQSGDTPKCECVIAKGDIPRSPNLAPLGYTYDLLHSLFDYFAKLPEYDTTYTLSDAVQNIGKWDWLDNLMTNIVIMVDDNVPRLIQLVRKMRKDSNLVVELIFNIPLIYTFTWRMTGRHSSEIKITEWRGGYPSTMTIIYEADYSGTINVILDKDNPLEYFYIEVYTYRDNVEPFTESWPEGCFDDGPPPKTPCTAPNQRYGAGAPLPGQNIVFLENDVPNVSQNSGCGCK
jgi:hypothetical protein